MMVMRERKPIGAPPETLMFSGTRRAEKTKLKWTCYDQESCKTVELKSISEIGKIDKVKNYWLDLSGLHDGDLVGAICQFFSINRMLGEDVMNTNSLSKLEEFENFIYISQKVPFEGREEDLEVHQLSMIIMENILISFIEEESDFFLPIYKRVNVAGSRMATNGVDYLAWALMDLGVDQTLSYISQLEIGLEKIEAMIIDGKSLPDLQDVHYASSEATLLYRALRPFRGVVQHLNTIDHPLFKESTRVYINDLLDHVGFAIESSEFLREHGANLRELYYTTTSHRMNEVMKVLAIVSGIFMPLSFLAGVYGMNFENMPELKHEYGYFIMLGVFILVASTLILIFKKRGWF
jgi:magnesium transporter